LALSITAICVDAHSTYHQMLSTAKPNVEDTAARVEPRVS